MTVICTRALIAVVCYLPSTPTLYLTDGCLLSDGDNGSGDVDMGGIDYDNIPLSDACEAPYTEVEVTKETVTG